LKDTYNYTLQTPAQHNAQEVRVKYAQWREYLDTPYSHRTNNKKHHKTSHVYDIHTTQTHTHKNKHTPIWITTHKIYGKPHNKWWLQNVPRITSFLRNTKQYYHLSYSSLCKYTLLPATVKVLETFLNTILWKPFQLFCHILNGVSSITKVLSHQCRFQSWEQVKISRSQVRRVWVMLQCCNIVLDYEILDQN